MKGFMRALNQGAQALDSRAPGVSVQRGGQHHLPQSLVPIAHQLSLLMHTRCFVCSVPCSVGDTANRGD